MSRLDLSARFTLILGLVFIIGISLGGYALWRSTQQTAQEEVSSKGLLMIETMNAVRGYTSQNVRPLLLDQLAGNPEFISESVPAFSARTVFEKFRSQEDFKSYLYREAAINPTNPADTADEFEADLLAQLSSGSGVAELEGYRELNDENLFYIARPLVLGAESCLECHSTPDQAPASLIATYGDQGGFGWELGQVIAAQIIYVPATEIFDAAFLNFTYVMAIFAVTFGLIILLINSLLNRYVVQPLYVLSGLADKISADENFAIELESSALQLITKRPDELGSLAQVFKKMATDVYERTSKLKNQVNQLIIKIDEIRRKEQVDEVTDSDFFNGLQKRANELRNRDKSASKD